MQKRENLQELHLQKKYVILYILYFILKKQTLTTAFFFQLFCYVVFFLIHFIGISNKRSNSKRNIHRRRSICYREIVRCGRRFCCSNYTSCRRTTCRRTTCRRIRRCYCDRYSKYIWCWMSQE